MRQFKAIAAGRIGRQNAFKHAALHVEEIVQLLARIFFPDASRICSSNRSRSKVPDARQAAIERLVESEVASICARTLTNWFNCNNFLCKEAQDFNVKVYIEKETVLIFLSADVPSAII